MTDRLLTALSRQPATRLVRPLAVLLLALALSYLGGLWLTVVHRADGAMYAPGFLDQWLRDATLTMPLVAAAVWCGVLLTRRVLTRAAVAHSVPVGASLLAMVVAGLAAAVTGVTGAVGSWLVIEGVEVERSFLGIVLRDALVALPVYLLIAGTVAACLARTTPWAEPQGRTWALPRRGVARLATQAVLGLMLLAPIVVLAQVGTQRAIAVDGPGTPCPAGAPLKSFNVNAIDVDIPLNRFGDRDTRGKMYAIEEMIPAIRAQEASRHVSSGLRDDPIQPLVIRANLGDCVEIAFRNQATGEFGMHIDGLAFDVGSSGDAVGNNPSSSLPNNGSVRLYRYYVPKDAELEGAHYIRPGLGNRDAVAHGLFGVLTIEPQGSVYLHPDTGAPLPYTWGWEATIKPGNGRKAFREANLLHHEIGNENYEIPTTSEDVAQQPAPNQPERTLPVKDPITGSYRPGSRAVNYRSEPFMHRLATDQEDRLKAFSYNSYTFGDPATPMPRGYLGDPTKIRLVHAGSEMFHVFHLHGGGDRWRSNPHADPTYDYGETGLNKTPVEQSNIQRLDSQSVGPGESYNLEIESGAGGTQQAAGDFLYHCHIAEHYVSGMWAVWRVFDTKQPDLAAMPDRAAPPSPVDSSELIGKKMPDGTVLTAENLDEWIEPQLPPRGLPLNRVRGANGTISMDGAVWDWTTGNDPDAGPNTVYYGEPQDRTGSIAGSPWAAFRFPNLKSPADGAGHAVPGHPGLLPVDAKFADVAQGYGLGPDERPRILFNPVNGRPAYPLLRTQIGQRPPYTPNGHTGSPWLGDVQNKPKEGAVDPWAGRSDGMCPQNSAPNTRDFNIVSIEKPIKVTSRNHTDDFGKLFVLAKNKDKVRDGTMPSEPLAIRANIGECVKLTVTSEQTENDPNQPFPMTNLHIHHVQFDPNGSDGATAGMTYGQAIRPYRVSDAQLAADAAAGAQQLLIKKPAVAGNELTNLAKYRVGIWVGVGLGTENLEIRKIVGIVPAGGGNITVTLDEPLTMAHGTDSWFGTEFVQETWFPDVVVDNVFWHDHVDGIHNWGHGLVGQLVIEPRGSTYHDPRTGQQVDSGTFVDIRTNTPLAPGVVDGSFREFVLWTIDQNPTTDSTLNLRAEPLSHRRAVDPDPSLLYSSYRHGDPFTPLPRAYVGDPFVIRTINVSPGVDTLHIDGHTTLLEPRSIQSGRPDGTPSSTVLTGISERYTLALQGGAGGPARRPGDYLYTNGIGRRIEHGAWGVLRVMPRQVTGGPDQLQVLLSNPNVPTGQSDTPEQTGGRPPAAGTAGEPCPAGAPVRSFAVSAVNVPGAVAGRTLAFVPSPNAAAVTSGTLVPEPLVLHATAGDCVSVTFRNELTSGRASFHVDKLARDSRSSGINVGFNPEQTVLPGGARVYRYHVGADNLGSAPISDYGIDDSGVKGLYGALVVAPAGATFTNPVTGAATDVGTQVDVAVPGQPSYRDFTLIFSDNEPILGINTMPYPEAVETPALINYRSAAGRALDANQFSSLRHGDPKTPLLQAHSGDPMRVHVIGAPGSEAQHVFNLGGHTWAWDHGMEKSEQLANQGFGPLMSLDLHVRGGAGRPGDYAYGDMRRPFTDAGMWGLMRVHAPGSGTIRPLANLPAAQPVVPVAPRAKLANLRVAKSVSKPVLTRNGLAFTLKGPNDVKALRVKLFRLGGKKPVLVSGANIEWISTVQFNRLSKTAKAARSRLAVAPTGTIRATWKLSPALVRKIRTGRYRLDVQAGPNRRAIDVQTLRAVTRVTAPIVRKP